MPKKPAPTTNEPDSVYFLKILLYFILGLVWIRYNGRAVFPAGLLLGIIFASHEHFRIDRKIEFAILLIATLIGLTGYGIFLAIN